MAVLLLVLLGTLSFTTTANAGTPINLTDEEWECDQELSDYGTLPIEVTIDYTTTDTVRRGVSLSAGCDGDENPATVDLIVHINGDGINGPYDDAIRIENSSAIGDIVISGNVDCGQSRADLDPSTPGNQRAHQDGVHAIGGHDIVLRDLYVGLNGPDGNPSCQGAGGALFYSGSSGVRSPSNMDVEGGEYRACNHAYIDGDGITPAPSGDVTNVVFRAGYDSGHADACEFTDGTKFTNASSSITTNTSVVETDIVEDEWPFIDVASLTTNTALTSGNTLTLTVPAGGVSLGNTLVLAAVHNEDGTGITATDSDGNVYTADEECQQGPNLSAYVLSSRLTNALEAGDTITITFPDTGSRRAAEAIRVEGLRPDYVGPQASDDQLGATSLSSGATATTTRSRAVVIGAFGWNNQSDGAETFTPGTSFTSLTTTTASNRQLFTEYREVAATGSYTATATASAAGHSASIVAVYYG
jgi:hypothetical protein